MFKSNGLVPAWIVEAVSISDGQPYPRWFLAITCTSYFVFGFRFVNKQEVDRELLYVLQSIHGCVEPVLLICGRYSVMGPPRASRVGGLHFTLMEVQPPVKSDCKIGGYGTSVTT